MSQTEVSLDAEIVDEQYHHFPGTSLTVCCLSLKNGHAVFGKSYCRSDDMFDAETGRSVARDSAQRNIWELEAYLQRQQNSEAD